MRIGICGGGIGGLVAGLACLKQGHYIEIYERSSIFGRVGADINLTPNAVHALDQLDIGHILRMTAAKPTHRISRMWNSGEETSRLPMGTSAEERYGAPQLTIHRADLIGALAEILPTEVLRLGAAVSGVDSWEDGATLTLSDGTRRDFDLVIGADGIHSVVRHALFGEDAPHYTGLVSYRAVFPRQVAADRIPNLDAFTKWWGPNRDRQIVVFPLSRGKEIFVFATTPQANWSEEGWTLPGDVHELRAAFADFHPEARAVLECCTEVMRSALHVRDPMPQWSKGATTLLGDAAHPMVPFMAQGATMAIEDGVVLSLALVEAPNVAEALTRYEAARHERTEKIQRASLANDWLRQPENADWVYAYRAWDAFNCN